MTPKDKNPRPERIETNSSLAAEREKMDSRLAKQGSELEKDADQIVQLARDRADNVLETARRKADVTLQQATKSTAGGDELPSARASADRMVTAERAAADDQLEAERVAQRQALKLLLSIDREETNERLLTERARSDHAVASRDDFLAMVSHDVRNILAGMAMSAELLIAIPLPDEEGEQAHKEAQRIRRLTGQMNRLIGDLLDVVSMESGTLKIFAKRQDAAPLLTEIMESFQLTAAGRKIRMTLAVAPGEAPARFDYYRILQVLTNLVGNAMKFTEPGGEIVLRLESLPSELRFTVHDSGRGIAPEQLNTIFERFAQIARVGGLGLGLYIARCIVAAHGGKIWVDSTPGEGSAFHFTLPKQ